LWERADTEGLMPSEPASRRLFSQDGQARSATGPVHSAGGAPCARPGPRSRASSLTKARARVSTPAVASGATS